jgi:hypothetical protein
MQRLQRQCSSFQRPQGYRVLRMWMLLLSIASALVATVLLLVSWPLLLDRLLLLVLPRVLRKLGPCNHDGRGSIKEGRGLHQPRIRSLRGGRCFLSPGV